MKTNLLLPIAGNGQRFIDAGYTVPKPLIEINGKTILDRSLESVKLDNCNLIFIIRQDHVKEHNLNLILKSRYKDCKIVVIPGLTEGALSTCMLAKEHIDNDMPLMIFTPDCYFEPQINPDNINESFDGMVCVFNSNSPAHSYVKLDENAEYVNNTAEKKVISNLAIGGLYYWKNGSDFVKYGNQMIEKDLRVNGEFYIAPVFNEFISDGNKVGIDRNTKHDILGTPEDLENNKWT